MNKHREFFYATPAKAKTHLLELSGDLLEYTEIPEAVEYRQSLNEAHLASGGITTLGEAVTPSPLDGDAHAEKIPTTSISASPSTGQ